MNKSTFFNHSLMKRRYSVPETVMRKHKLQEAQPRKRYSDQQSQESDIKTGAKFKDESCQTEESNAFFGHGNKVNNSQKKNSKGKRRESIRCFRKANSYCQYKSLSMFHKRMIARGRDAHSLSSLENLQSDAGFSADRAHPTDDPQTDVPKTEELQKSASKNTMAFKRSEQTRHFSDPPPHISSTSFCGTDQLNEKCCRDKLSAAAERFSPRCVGQELFDTSNPRKVLVNSKSLDQNTSGYNTVSNSLDDTPRRKTPDSSKASPKETKSDEMKKEEELTDDLFPITFHSESVFVHPYQKGFLSHKELHHISIQVVPDMKMENSNDYYKTEIKVNVNDSTEEAKTRDSTTNRMHSVHMSEDANQEKNNSQSNSTICSRFGNELHTGEHEARIIKREVEEFQGTDATACMENPAVIIDDEAGKSELPNTIEKTEQEDMRVSTSLLTPKFTKYDETLESTNSERELTSSKQIIQEQVKETEIKLSTDKKFSRTEDIRLGAAEESKSLHATEDENGKTELQTPETTTDAQSDEIGKDKDARMKQNKTGIVSPQSPQTTAEHSNLEEMLANRDIISPEAATADTEYQSGSTKTTELGRADCTQEYGTTQTNEKSLPSLAATTASCVTTPKEELIQCRVNSEDQNVLEQSAMAPNHNICTELPPITAESPGVTITEPNTISDDSTQRNIKSAIGKSSHDAEANLTHCVKYPSDLKSGAASVLETRDEPISHSTVSAGHIPSTIFLERNLIQPETSSQSKMSEPIGNQKHYPSDVDKLQGNLDHLTNLRDSRPNVCMYELNHAETPNKNAARNHFNCSGRRDSDDCSVPTTFNPVKFDEPSKLKIEVDVGNVDFSTSIQDMLLGRKVEHTTADNQLLTSQTREPVKHADKYNPKTALSYLFQKLGDSYPKRHLLKQTTFHDYSQYGRYYSDLPKISSRELPPQVLYNNQTYDILSGNLLPNEITNFRHVPIVPDLAGVQKLSEYNNDHSDSDISIPDSLEDFQQAKSRTNKYQKYDERLARGDVTDIKPPAKTNKKEGISYFIPLVDNIVPNTADMPLELKEKLCKRSNSISKHSSCIESPKKSPKSNSKLIHKQIQTCLNVEDSLKKRRKKLSNEALSRTDKQGQKIESQSELDERIANILMAGLRLQDAERNTHKNGIPSSNRNTSSQSAQTDTNTQPIISEYVEMYKMQSTTGSDFKPSEQGEFFDNSAHAQNNLYELILSEEETGRINSTNYYRTFKKSRRIYYPTKDQPHSSGKSEDTRSHSTQNHAPVFSKYQRRLKEFKQQTRRQIQDRPGPSEPSNNGDTQVKLNGVDKTLLPLPYPKTKKTYREKTFKVRSHISKIPGPRNHRFYQRFEAIPEELSNSSSEQQDVNGNAFETNTSSAPVETNSDSNVTCHNKSDDKDAGDSAREKEINSDENQNTETKEIHEKRETEDKYYGMTKSHKGRDSLSGVNEHEELITLSRGWINFYLLKGNSVEENGTTEDHEDPSPALFVPPVSPIPTIYMEAGHNTCRTCNTDISARKMDENVTLSETFCIPQQYTVHVHATPETSTPSPKMKSTFPGLCKSGQKRDCKNDKAKQINKTSLPDIGTTTNSNHCQYSSRSNSKMNQRQNSLPKLHLSGDESDGSSIRRQDDGDSRDESSAEPVKKDSARSETPASTTCSHRSKSPADNSLGKYKTKKVQRYQRPHTYHSTRNCNQWSLTVEGSHNTNEKRLASDIEMQLLLKNNHEGVATNHSWKLTVREEAENADDSHMDRNSHPSCLPHLNVNYNMLPYVYPDDNTSRFSESYTRSNSVSSYCDEKYLNKDVASHSMKRFNKDLKIQVAKSDDELTVKGLAITPERKPRVPTMSERDLTRMRLIKPTRDSRL